MSDEQAAKEIEERRQRLQNVNPDLATQVYLREMTDQLTLLRGDIRQLRRDLARADGAATQ